MDNNSPTISYTEAMGILSNNLLSINLVVFKDKEIKISPDLLCFKVNNDKQVIKEALKEYLDYFNKHKYLLEYQYKSFDEYILTNNFLLCFTKYEKISMYNSFIHYIADNKKYIDAEILNIAYDTVDYFINMYGYFLETPNLKTFYKDSILQKSIFIIIENDLKILFEFQNKIDQSLLEEQLKVKPTLKSNWKFS